MCIIPFKFNGQQYDSCMLMTAQRLTELGVVGFDPKVTLDDVIPVCATKVDPATLLPTQPLKNSLGRCRKDCPKRNSTIYKDKVSIVERECRHWARTYTRWVGLNKREDSKNVGILF